ncbi:MAG: LysE family translocator [Candidatus Thermoplasmatota archaeon]|nr:LysE family translocator [Candidatus Thermoplasmatota archaeon]|tara:strand:+ start:651 stop:1277 length:627 start_codon:yes stop_codon:yes gene_type:complete
MEGLAWEAIFAAGTFFFLGAISPGPSVMVVIRNTIVGGRSQGVACAVGHGIGFGIYAISAVFGLIVLLENAPDVFLILQLIGVGLLVWYGYLMWFDEVNLDGKSGSDSSKIKQQGFIEGFSIAFFNPKIALFLVAVLAQVLEPGMGIGTKLAIGILGMSIDMIWYLVVALALTGTGAVDWLRMQGQLIYRITAIALWVFAASVIYSLL